MLRVILLLQVWRSCKGRRERKPQTNFRMVRELTYRCELVHAHRGRKIIGRGMVVSSQRLVVTVHRSIAAISGMKFVTILSDTTKRGRDSQ
jgi:hypothetical protein